MNLVKRFTIFGTVAIASLAIAQSASARFVIFVSGNDPATLQRVRTFAPTAFATKINDQPAIQAGTFNSETSADSLAIALQQSGLSAQKYFRPSSGKESAVQVPFLETPAPVLNSPSITSPSPQQVVIQPNSIPSPVSFQVDSQPQQAIVYNYNNQSQLVTNAVVPQVQTQQVLVPRWQQVLVPETRQFVTQVPQTQILQTGGYTQSATTTYAQPTLQPTSYLTTPQTAFIPASSAVPMTTVVPTTNDSYNFAQVQPVANTGYTTNEPQLPQAAQNPNFRYVAAVPSTSTNQFLLSRVRQYVPSAFLSNSGRGTYIHAGAYQNRDSAEAVSRYLRSQGVDSRVLYF